MADVLFIIAEQNFRDEELFDTKKELEKSGISSIIASKTAGEKTGSRGGKAKAEIALKNVKVDDYKAIVFVGGQGSKQYFNDSEALGIAKKAFEKGKIIAAICIAPVILANAGILKNKKATVYQGNEQELEKKGAIIAKQNVVKDGKIITACGPLAAKEFGTIIAKELKNV